MTEPCFFCGGPVNPHDEGIYKRVSGWVHGKKRDSMTLREDTGDFAHTACVLKVKGGNAPDQPDLFGEDTVVTSVQAEQDFTEFIEGLDKEIRATGFVPPKFDRVADIEKFRGHPRTDESGEDLPF